MPEGHARLRAKLLWEVTCERLRNALEPPAGAPEGSPATLAEAYRLAHGALEAVRQAFDIDPGTSTGTTPIPFRSIEEKVMKAEAIHCVDIASVRFAIYPDGLEGPRVLAEISDDALRDLFGADGDGDSLVNACRANFGRIEAAALQRHRAEPFKAVKLGVRDFTDAAAFPGDAGDRDRTR
jgi:hypothetical protein